MTDGPSLRARHFVQGWNACARAPLKTVSIGRHNDAMHIGDVAQNQDVGKEGRRTSSRLERQSLLAGVPADGPDQLETERTRNGEEHDLRLVR